MWRQLVVRRQVAIFGSVRSEVGFPDCSDFLFFGVPFFFLSHFVRHRVPFPNNRVPGPDRL